MDCAAGILSALVKRGGNIFAPWELKGGAGVLHCFALDVRIMGDEGIKS